MPVKVADGNVGRFVVLTVAEEQDHKIHQFGPYFLFLKEFGYQL